MISFDQFQFDGITAKNFILLPEDQLKEILRWRTHPSIREWMYNDQIIELDEHLNFVASLKNKKNDIYWQVQLDNEDIGVVSLNRINFLHKNAYIGIYANPFSEIKNKGAYLFKILFEIGFNKLMLHSLKLEVISTNKRVIRFYERMGFAAEGTLKEFVYRNDKWIDVIVMGIINSED